jgi:hypothetical protein
MNNNFVKDNLLPDERILATAKWHWMKNWAFPIMLFLISILFFILAYYEAESTKQRTINSCSYELRKSESNPILYNMLQEHMDYCQSRSVLSYFWSNVENADDVNAVFCIISLFFAFISFFITKWLTKYDEFAITNLRVVAKVGVIRRIAFELHNEQVESIGIYQGILGRSFGYGTLIPGGVGASKVRIRFVKDPFELRQHFYDLKKGQQVTQN